MLSLDELLSDPLCQRWDYQRVITALSRGLKRHRSAEVARWFYFAPAL